MVYQGINFRRFINFLTPGVCFLCQDCSVDQSIFCLSCYHDLPRSQTNGSLQAANTTREDCCDAPAAIDRTIASHIYKFPVNKLIHQLKYRRKMLIAKELGLDLASAVSKVSASVPDCLVPVPLYRLRFLARGFNQALEIANVVGSELSLPVDTGLILRARNTLAQFTLNPKQRTSNLRGAFRLRSKPDYDFVAIIDDVITTGATVNEMAALLKRAGVKRVEAWACARAES